jgi:hypothetical protein
VCRFVVGVQFEVLGVIPRQIKWLSGMLRLLPTTLEVPALQHVQHQDIRLGTNDTKSQRGSAFKRLSMVVMGRPSQRTSQMAGSLQAVSEDGELEDGGNFVDNMTARLEQALNGALMNSMTSLNEASRVLRVTEQKKWRIPATASFGCQTAAALRFVCTW